MFADLSYSITNAILAAPSQGPEVSKQCCDQGINWEKQSYTKALNKVISLPYFFIFYVLEVLLTRFFTL